MAASSCSAVGFTVTPVNGANGIVPAGTTYSWPVPVVTGGMTGGAAGAGAANINGNLTNPTITSQTATYTVTPTSGSCTGTTFTVTVTINPMPAVTNMTATACSGTTFTVTPVDGTNGLVPPGTTYSWPVPVVTGGVTGGAIGSGAASISGTLTNPTNIVQTATYTVTPTSGSCTGSTFTVTVTLNPKPSISNMTAAVCSGGTFTVIPANGVNGIVPAGTTYSWAAPAVTGGMTGGAAGAGAANISGTLINPTNVNQTATYTVTPTSGTCAGSTFTVTVTVNPVPAISAMNASACSATAFTVTPANGTNGIVPAGTTYSWAAPAVTGGMTGGAAGAGAANINGNLTNPTSTAQTATYTVTPTSGTCTGATFTVTVTINPKPVVPAQTATICSGTSPNFVPVNNPPTTIVPAGTTYTWANPVVTGGITGGSAQAIPQASVNQTLTNPTNIAQTATYTVIPTSGGCAGNSFVLTVTVNPKPSITNMTSAICSGGTFTATPVNGANGIVPAGTTYSWAPPTVTGGITGGAAGAGAANISGTLTNPTNSAQTATYTITPTSGSCAGNTFMLTVTVNPKPAITPMTAAVCSGGTFTVTPVDGTNGVVPPGTTYSWPVPVVTGGITGGSAGAGAANISGTLTNPLTTPQTATYTVTPTVGGCSGNTFTVTVSVNPPIINNNIQLVTICETALDSAYVMIDQGIPGPLSGGDGTYTYQWVFSTPGNAGPYNPVPGQTGSTLIFGQTVNNGFYKRVVTSGGCTSTSNFVHVNTNNVIGANSFAVTGGGPYCSGGAGSPVGLSGSSASTPEYTITYRLLLNGVYTGISLSGTGAPLNFGNQTVPGTYTVEVVVAVIGGTTCAASTATGSAIVTILPLPTITLGTIPAICSGTTANFLPYSATTNTPNQYSVVWDAAAIAAGFVNVTNAALPVSPITLVVPVAAPAATYTATLTVTNSTTGCTSNGYPISFTVNPKPTITLGPNPSVCSGATSANLTYSATTGSPNQYSITWSAAALAAGFVNVTNAILPASPIVLVVPAAAPVGIYTATLTVTNTTTGCSNNGYPISVTINPNPTITLGPDPSVCSGATSANLTYSATTGSPNQYSITWSAAALAAGFANVTNAALPASPIVLVVPGAAAVGSYTGTLTVTNSATGCTSTGYPVSVTINAIPTITLGANPSVCSGSTSANLTYSSTTGTPTQYSITWSAGALAAGFVNVTNAALPASPIILVVPGAAPPATYTGTLTVTNSITGCVSAAIPISVTVLPVPAPPVIYHD
jgi:hypothetical protein